MRSYIGVTVIVLFFLQGCMTNEQYHLSERERIQRYLYSNPGAIKRVRDISFLLFLESKPEEYFAFRQFINELKKVGMDENISGNMPLSRKQLFKETDEIKLFEFIELRSRPLSDDRKEEIIASFLEVVNKILDLSLSDNERERILASFIGDNVDVHGEIDEYIKEDFLNGRVICGMNKDDVIAIKGRPNSRYESTDSAFRKYSSWSYDSYRGSETIRFRNDVVDDISTYKYRYNY